MVNSGFSYITASEQCDDNNTLNNDGCDSACQIEFGWDCPVGTPSICKKCGDGSTVIQNMALCNPFSKLFKWVRLAMMEMLTLEMVVPQLVQSILVCEITHLEPDVLDRIHLFGGKWNTWTKHLYCLWKWSEGNYCCFVTSELCCRKVKKLVMMATQRMVVATVVLVFSCSNEIGDGCSSACLEEPGFSCNTPLGGATTCKFDTHSVQIDNSSR